MKYATLSAYFKQKEVITMNNDINKLSHTSWNCKYHIVFAPKYRRQVFYKEKRIEIGQILRQLCEWIGKIQVQFIQKKTVVNLRI